MAAATLKKVFAETEKDDENGQDDGTETKPRAEKGAVLQMSAPRPRVRLGGGMAKAKTQLAIVHEATGDLLAAVILLDLMNWVDIAKKQYNRDWTAQTTAELQDATRS